MLFKMDEKTRTKVIDLITLYGCFDLTICNKISDTDTISEDEFIVFFSPEDKTCFLLLIDSILSYKFNYYVIYDKSNVIGMNNISLMSDQEPILQKTILCCFETINNEKKEYYVYDILVWNGKIISPKLNFLERITILKNYIISSLQSQLFFSDDAKLKMPKFMSDKELSIIIDYIQKNTVSHSMHSINLISNNRNNMLIFSYADIQTLKKVENLVRSRKKQKYPQLNIPPIIRGIYENNNFNFKTYFDSKEECEKWCLSNIKNVSSNPDFDYDHIYTFIIGIKQLINYLIKPMIYYDNRYRTEKCDDKNFLEDLYFSSIKPIKHNVIERLDLPIHKKMYYVHDKNIDDVKNFIEEKYDKITNKNILQDSVLHTLSYIYNHLRAGIFVMIRSNKLVMFVPFVNNKYKNNWYKNFTQKIEYGNLKKYYAKKRRYYRKENIMDISQWWANNGGIIDNEQERRMWGDAYLVHVKDMLENVLKYRRVYDCQFFFNKRDHPYLRYHHKHGKYFNLVEPYDFLFDVKNTPLKNQFNTYSPVLSFYVGDDFADIPIPVTEDWELAVGKVFPTKCNDINLPIKREQNQHEWKDKINTAFFRGTATGSGTKINNNQRLQLAFLSSIWKKDVRYNENNPVDRTLYLNAGVSSWNIRDKKEFGEKMTFIRPNFFPFKKAKFVEMSEQLKYKYIIYAQGHSAASRYSFLMISGNVILKIQSTCNAPYMWYFPLLKSDEDIGGWKEADHVFVKSDMSNLAEKILWCKTHDEECKKIVSNARNMYEKYLRKNSLMDYMQYVLCEISERTIYI